VDPKELGRLGEDLAARYLESQGWNIVGRNLRDGPREVDLAVFRGGTLAVVEVKTRRGSGYGHPLEAITPKKRLEIARVSRGLIRRLGLPYDTILRFDAVGVILAGGKPPRIIHVQDAWRLEHGRD
jgi:putative endonuclease